MPPLSSLPTAILFRDLEALVTTHRACTANIVRHLAEVDARRAYAERGHSSLFGYCTDALRLSEDEACRRVEAARLLNKFPHIGSLLDSGAVSLSVLGALKPHLTPANHQDLLAGVNGMSRRNADAWLARRFPRADVRESVRLLPTQTIHAVRRDAEATSNGPSQQPAAPVMLEVPLLAMPPTRSVARIEPRSADRYAIHVTVGRDVKEQLELACDLLRHRNPSGDLETVVAAAVTALVERLKIEKLGALRGRSNGSERRSHPPESTKTPRANEDEDEASTTVEALPPSIASSRQTRRPRVPNAVRRAVVARDGIGCSHVGCDGQRCNSRAFLEFDHVKPLGTGGTNDVSNLRLLCRAHNRLEADRVYGRAFMDRARLCDRSGAATQHRTHGAAPSVINEDLAARR